MNDLSKLSAYNIFKSIKLIKKTRSEKTCRGCGKDIPIGSSCLNTFEFLQTRYANDYFCNEDCIKNAISKFFGMIKESQDFINDHIEKTKNK